MNGLPVVLWLASGYQFALEACRVTALQPYDPSLDGQPLHWLIPGLEAEAPLYCLGWQAEQGLSGWLVIAGEPQHLELPLDSLRPLPASLRHARCHTAIQALAWHQGQPVTLLHAASLGS